MKYYVDMDEVLCDFAGNIKNFFNRNMDLTKDKIHEIYGYKHEGAFWNIIDNAPENILV
jgi:hypothetical protein